MQITRQTVTFLYHRQFLQLFLSHLKFLHQSLVTITRLFHLLDGVPEKTTDNERDRIEHNRVDSLGSTSRQGNQAHDPKTKGDPHGSDSGCRNDGDLDT